MNNSSMIYALPESKTIGGVMFGTPMDYTGGLFINVFLIGFFAMITIGGVTYQKPVQKVLVFSTFSTFIVTFLVSMAGYAGGNQLIPAAVAFMLAVAYNKMESGGGL